jgi:hypothetical protein
VTEPTREEIIEFLQRWDAEQALNPDPIVPPILSHDDPCPIKRAVSYFPPLKLH